MREGRNTNPPTDELVIDISAAVNQGAGIGRYARELSRQLIPLLDPEATHLWYAEDESSYDAGLLQREPWRRLPIRKALISRLNVDRLVIRENLPLMRLLRLGRPTDLYSPDFTAPMSNRARSHITVHDLAWLHPEAKTPPPLANFLAPVVARSVRSATTVFAVSHTVRQEILERYPISEDRVLVASNAAAAQFFEAAAMREEELLKLAIRPPFLLIAGAIEPRKNVETLIEAMVYLPRDVQLVIAGRAGWNAPAILGRIAQLGLAGRVVTLGFVPDYALPNLMATADCVVTPSHYEGFGLPIVEALATGAPVAASNLPVFREVGGQSVRYFDQRDPGQLAGVLAQVLAEGSPAAERSKRVEQARQFDWTASAHIVANRLRDVS